MLPKDLHYFNRVLEFVFVLLRSIITYLIKYVISVEVVHEYSVDSC